MREGYSMSNKIRQGTHEVSVSRVKQVKEDLSSALISLTLANSSLVLLDGIVSSKEFDELYYKILEQQKILARKLRNNSFED